MGIGTAKRANTARRRAQAIELRIQGASWEQIAEDLGYASKGAACTDVTRALLEARSQIAQGAEAYRDMELRKLDRLEAETWRVMLADHPVVQSGKIVEGVSDAGPILRAVQTVLRIAERRAKLLGLDEPERIEAVVVAEVQAQTDAIANLFEGALVDAELTAEQQMAVKVAAARRIRELSA